MTTAFTPNAKNHAGLGPMASRLVHANDMPWEPINYPGVFVKTLMLDKATGLLTVLLKMEPGAELPDHEHALMEQTYVMEGRLIDKDGPEKGLEVGPGEFVYRPAGSRHSAYTPEGGLMLAIFHVPNKFYESGGKVVDLIGDEWGAKWGHVVG
ncbi:MAG: ChrR Cupin-like domain protein [Ramlibacter sp.]|nr:ChrR Cupin-like domain protein [Ramlibacter sp.]